MRSDEEPSWMAETPNGAADTGAGDAGNVDKIRDILFGSQMRDYDRRFATTEERLQREAAALRDDLGRRLLATEQYLRGEVETLAGNLKTEEADRVHGLRAASDALATLQRELSDRLADLADQTAQQHRELVCGINVELIGALKDNLAFGKFEAVYDPRPGWCCVVITRIQA